MLPSRIIAVNAVNAVGAQVGHLVRAPKTAELIAQQLRRQIVRGELPPGQSLPPEQQLMEQFGVSRPTLREAFRVLETEKLISVRRGSRGGAQVISPDISTAARSVGLLLQMQGTTIDDVYEARMVSEPACARLLAKHRTAQDLDDLRWVIDELGVAIESQDGGLPDPARWSRLTFRFHELVVQRCGNKTLAVQGAVLQDIVATHLAVRAVRSYEETESPTRFRAAIKVYKKFVTLVEARDAEGAEQHWRRYMQASAKYLLKDDLHNKSVVDLFSSAQP